MNAPTISSSLVMSVALAVCTTATAQTARTLPLTADAWDAGERPVEFVEYRGTPALRLGAAGRASNDATVTLRNFVFADGTLEFDHAMEDSSFFSAVHFRRVDEANSEHAYLRTFFAGQTRVNEAFQYAAIVDGVNYWDISPDFQAAVAIDSAAWNHVKLVVRGSQLLAYVNDMSTPALYVPHMDGGIDRGALGFSGRGYYANVTYSPSTKGLGGDVGYDPTLGDGRYLREWTVSAPRPIPKTQGLSTLSLPADTVAFRPITAERLGLVNLSRPFGKTAGDERRVAWLRQTITSETAREVPVDLGFSDEVAVWVNGRLAHVDENNWGTPQMKYPLGRASIDNAQFTLPLKAGENEVTVAVANDFFGWGLLMRLRETEGLSVGGDVGTE